jgi:hypothetical protein
METREADTQGRAWVDARLVASLLLGSAYSTYGEPNPIPWWRPIPRDANEREALSVLRLLVRGGVVRQVVP